MSKYIFFVLIIILVIIGCKESTDALSEIKSNSGIEGQLYANAGPGFHLEKAIVSIVVLKDDTTTIVTEAKSDSNGIFKINLKPGVYLLYVKESHDIYYSGPYEVEPESYTKVEAYLYDARIV